MAESGTSLLPVIVGGLLTMAGGIVGFLGTVIRDVIKTKQEKQKLRADKFEEMVATLYEYDHYMDVVRDIMLYTKLGELMETEPASPFAKLHAISAVYFPEFDKKILELEVRGSDYRLWLATARDKFVGGKYDTYTDGYNEAHGPFLKAVRDLLEDFKKFARTEFQ